jgi:hypothetical protein
MYTRKHFNSFLIVMTLITVVGLSLPVWAFEGVISEDRVPAENYCHTKFPAIRPSTLASTRPVLKSPNSADIIDYYGPCDHDPLGKDEVLKQQEDRQLFLDHRQG